MVNVLVYVASAALGGVVAWFLKPPKRSIADCVKAYKAGEITDREMIIGIYEAIRWSKVYPIPTEAEIQHELTALHVEAGGDPNLWVSRFLNAWRLSDELAGWSRKVKVSAGDFLFR